MVRQEDGFTIYFNDSLMLVYKNVSVLPSRWLRRIARKLKLKVMIFPNQAIFEGKNDSDTINTLRYNIYLMFLHYISVLHGYSTRPSKIFTWVPKWIKLFRKIIHRLAKRTIIYHRRVPAGKFKWSHSI